MAIDEKTNDKVLNVDLERQISNAIDPRFLLQLVCWLLLHVNNYTDSIYLFDSLEL